MADVVPAHDPAALARQLAIIRRYRRIMIIAVALPPGAVIVVGLLNRLLGGALSFLSNGDPWTFWLSLSLARSYSYRSARIGSIRLAR
jgi:hypothetical protein